MGRASSSPCFSCLRATWTGKMWQMRHAMTRFGRVRLSSWVPLLATSTPLTPRYAHQLQFSWHTVLVKSQLPSKHCTFTVILTLLCQSIGTTAASAHLDNNVRIDALGLLLSTEAPIMTTGSVDFSVFLVFVYRHRSYSLHLRLHPYAVHLVALHRSNPLWGHCWRLYQPLPTRYKKRCQTVWRL